MPNDSLISSRSDSIPFTGGIWFGSTIVRGIGGSTRRFFANAIVSLTSESSSVFQSAMANPLSADPIGPSPALPYCCELRGVDTVDNRRRGASRGRGHFRAVAPLSGA
jgi:hypothetical protein